MKFLNDWKTVLLKAWSVKLIAIAAVLDGLATAFPYLQDVLGVPVGTFAALSGLVSAAALVARVISQDSVPAKAAPIDPNWESRQQTPVDLPDEHV